jgi:hypothetical protein
MIRFNERPLLIPKPGTIINNRTRKYLAPSLLLYDTEFVKRIRQLSILSFGIEIYHNNPQLIFDSNYLILLVDINGKVKNNQYINIKLGRLASKQAIDYIKTHRSFISLTPVNNATESLFYLKVLLPTVVNAEIIRDFIAGRYSNLYTKNQIEMLFPKHVVSNNIKVLNQIYQILHKQKEYRKIFIHKINQDFKGSYKDDFILPDAELDYPPVLHSEVFEAPYNFHNSLILNDERTNSNSDAC